MSLRAWIRLVENERLEDLFWFWYQPSSGEFRSTEGLTHSMTAYDMGYDTKSASGDDLSDDQLLSTLLNDGWVRGRYGSRRNGGGWYTDGGTTDLSLQGRRDLVLKTARFVAQHRVIENLFIDFKVDGEVHDAMDSDASVHLTGDEIERYLKRGILRKR